MSKFAACSLREWLGSADWGDVPTWLGAVASAAALVAAVAAVISARKAFSLEVGRDLEREREARREQASKVSAWPELRSGGAWSSSGLVGLVHNGSAEPVHDVELHVWKHEEQVGIVAIPGLTPPGDFPKSLPEEVYPKSTRDARGNPVAIEPFDPTSLSLEVKFTDAHGRRWWRSRDGQLHLELEPLE